MDRQFKRKVLSVGNKKVLTAIFASAGRDKKKNYKKVGKYLNAFDASNGLPNCAKNTVVVGGFFFFFWSKGVKLYAWKVCTACEVRVSVSVFLRTRVVCIIAGRKKREVQKKKKNSSGWWICKTKKIKRKGNICKCIFGDLEIFSQACQL